MRRPSLIVVATLALFSLNTAALGQDRDERRREEELIRKKKLLAQEDEKRRAQDDDRGAQKKALMRMLEELAKRDPEAAGMLKGLMGRLFESWRGEDDARGRKLDLERLHHEKLHHEKLRQESLAHEKMAHERMAHEKLIREKEELLRQKEKLAHSQEKKPATKDAGPFPEYTRELLRAIAERDPEAGRALKEILGRIAERAERSQRHQELEKMAHGLIESVGKRDPEGARELMQFFRRWFAHENDRRAPAPQPEKRRPDERPRRGGNVEGEEEAPKKEEVSETI